MTSNTDKYQKIADSILSRLGDDVGKWQKSWRSIGMARNLDGREYTGRNILLSLLMAHENYELPFFGTYKALQKKGLQVKKGEKAFPVIYFSIIEKEQDGETSSFPLMRTYNVFNVDQCDGEKSDFVKPDDYINADSRIEKIDAWVESLDIIIDNGGDNACYYPTLHRINMPTFDRFKSANDYYATLFHELTHSTKKELKREQSKQFGDPTYALEELIAESGAAILMSHFGLTPQLRDDHLQYIQHWIKKLKDDPKVFIDAFSQATKAVNLLLGIKPESQLKDVA